MRGSNPRLLAHKTNALTTELMGRMILVRQPRSGRASSFVGGLPKVRTPGIEPGTIRCLQLLQSNALPTELCPVLLGEADLLSYRLFQLMLCTSAGSWSNKCPR